MKTFEKKEDIAGMSIVDQEVISEYKAVSSEGNSGSPKSVKSACDTVS